MKLFSSMLCLVFLFGSICAQDQDIQIFEKKDGNKNIVVARNVGKVSYLVTVTINATGMDVTPSMEVEAVVPAGFMKEMATLTPRPGQAWSYGYDVSFVEYTGQTVKSTPTATPKNEIQTTETAPRVAQTTPPPPVTSNPTGSSATTVAPLVIYTQEGCGRCAYVKKELTAKGVAYKEVDVNSGVPEVNTMWKQLRDSGFTGDNVTMPVVSVNGKLHYNIKDLTGFVNGIKL